MSADLSRPAEVLAKEVEYSEEEEVVWEWYLRLKSVRKAAAEASTELGKRIAPSTAGYWIKERSEREQAMRQVMHLFDQAQQQLMVGHTLNLMYSDAQVAVRADSTRLEKLGPYMLAIIDRYCKLLGLDSPTRISIEDDRRNTVQVSYQEMREFSELEAANATKLDEIKRRK